MIEKDRMTILGDPLSSGFGSRLKAVGLRSDVQMSLLAFTFTAAACQVFAPHASTEAVLKLSLLTGGSGIIGAGAMRFGELGLAAYLTVNKTPQHNGCKTITPVVITMKPSNAFTKERLLWQTNAKTLRTGVAVLFATVCAAPVLMAPMDHAIMALSTLAALTPAAARMIEGWWRWTHVAKGTWAAEAPIPSLLTAKKTPTSPNP